MKQSGLMTLHFIFEDGARAELLGIRVVMHEQGKQQEMAIDELPQARIDELLSFGLIKIVACSLPNSEATWPTQTPVSSA